MTELIISGETPRRSTARVSGAKNAALPMMAAATLLGAFLLFQVQPLIG
jgi:UDP-N-acetylglucosamine enolpyruvyl transferase